MKKYLSVLFLYSLIFLFSVSAASAVPQLINYQGKLTDSAGTPITGTRNITFSLYDDANAGNMPWTETQSVNLSNGIFSVTLGSTEALSPGIFIGDSLYLGVTVEGDAEMTPRQRLTSAAYAQKAAMTESIPSVINGDISITGTLTLSGSPTSASHAATKAYVDAAAGGAHTHSGTDITSGTVAEPYIADAIARDSEIMPTVLANDGSGSGLNADLLDGLSSADFLRTTGGTATGAITVNASTAVGVAAIYGNQSGSGIGIKGFTYGSGYAVYGYSTGTSYAVYGNTSGTGVNSNAVFGLNSGSLGNAVYGYKTGLAGRAGYFQIANSSNASEAVYATTNGSGKAVSGNTSGTGDAVYGSSSGAGNSVYGIMTGLGTAGKFEVNNPSNTGNALYATTNGAGNAINATTNGAGDTIYASTTGTGNAGNFDGKVNVSGSLTVGTNLTVSSPTVPATATSTGTTGQIAYDANFVYICVATDTWKRAALSTW